MGRPRETARQMALRGLVTLCVDAAMAGGNPALADALAAALLPGLTAPGGPAAGCNAGHNAYPALRQTRRDALAAGRSGFVGLQLTQQSTHVDAEGEDTSALTVAACGQGRPQPVNVQALRALAANWAQDMALGRRSESLYPGGAFVAGLLAQQRAMEIR